MRIILWVLAAIVALLVAATAVGYFTLKRGDLPYATLAETYAYPDSQYLDLDGGVRLHYRDVGPQAKPTVLMVHGFSASVHTWDAWTAALADDYRMVSLDLPGHGLTEAPEGYQASIPVYRDVVRAFAEAKALEDVVIVGSSMGGNVAWEYALAYPDDVAGLVLVAASGWEDTREAVRNEPPIFALLRNPITRPILRDLDNTALIRQGLEGSFVNASLVDDAMVARYGDLARAPGHRDILLQMTLDFRARDYATNERLAPLAQTPTLIMHGRQDNLVPVAHAEQFAAALPHAQVQIWDNVGHIPQEEIPAESVAVLRDFLSAQAFPPAEAAAEEAAPATP